MQLSFKKRDIDQVYTQEFLDTPRESPWGKTQDQKSGLEFSLKDYKELMNIVKRKAFFGLRQHGT